MENLIGSDHCPVVPLQSEEWAMGIKSLFKGSGSKREGNKEPFPWIPVDTTEQLEALLHGERNGIAILFKHSTSCGLSGMMLRRFQKLWESSPEEVDFYLLDVIGRREFSNRISSHFGVLHQSPQVLVLKDHTLLAHASHGDINGIRPDGILKTPD